MGRLSGGPGRHTRNHRQDPGVGGLNDLVNVNGSLTLDGVLDVGETWVYSATYDATQADINAGTDLVNTASVVTTELPTPEEDE